MSDVSNKDLVKKSQEILSKMGVEVKTTQLYELFSQLKNEKNWNIAKSKGINFSSLFEELTKPQFSIIPSGIMALDKDLQGGFQSQQIISVWGQPNTGKSGVVSSIAANILENNKEKFRVLHISLEGQLMEIASKYYSRLGNIPLNKLYKKEIKKEELDKINETYKNRLKILIPQKFEFTVKDLHELLIQEFKQVKYDFIIIDYIQLLHSENKNIPYPKQMELTMLSLKNIASNLNCTIITPIMGLLGDSDSNESFYQKNYNEIETKKSIARGSDIILEIKTTEEEMNRNQLRLCLSKQLNGPIKKSYILNTNYDIFNVIKE